MALTVLLFSFPVLLGLAMVLLARWARKRNTGLTSSQLASHQGAFRDAMHEGNALRAAQLLFFGSLSPAWRRAGTLLAVGVVLLVGGVLGLVVFLLVQA